MKNEIIQGGREIGKTTYLFQLAETSVNNGINVINEYKDKFNAATYNKLIELYSYYKNKIK